MLPKHIRISYLIAPVILLFIGFIILTNFIWFNEDEYVIYTGADSVVVKGKFATVSEVIQASEIDTHAADMIVPAPDYAVDPKQAIIINRTEAVEIQINDESSTFWTHQSNLASFLSEISVFVHPTDRLIVDGKLISDRSLTNIPLPNIVQIEQHKDVTILDGQKTLEQSTMAQTVGETLADAGIMLHSADSVEPELGDWLEDKAVITIRRALPISILVDGRRIETLSHRTSALDVLSDNLIALVGQDFVNLESESELLPGDTIEVVRVTNEYELIEEPVPFGSALVANDDLELDQITLMNNGATGLKKRQMMTRYEDGLEVAQLPAGEWVSREPVAEVTGYGTRIVVRTMETPDGPIEYWRRVSMRATSYTAASAGKSRDDPAYGITASGMPAGTGIAAIDPSVVPFRSSLYVPGYGIAFAGDTGGGVKGRIIDLGYDEGELVSWRGFVDVYYLTPVPPAEDINYLIP